MLPRLTDCEAGLAESVKSADPLVTVTLAVPLVLPLVAVTVKGPPVAPPAVAPTQCRLRTSLMATHTFDQIDFCLETFAKIGRELGVI